MFSLIFVLGFVVAFPVGVYIAHLYLRGNYIQAIDISSNILGLLIGLLIGLIMATVIIQLLGGG